MMLIAFKSNLLDLLVVKEPFAKLMLPMVEYSVNSVFSALLPSTSVISTERLIVAILQIATEPT